jgi:hypothetical protein
MINLTRFQIFIARLRFGIPVQINSPITSTLPLVVIRSVIRAYRQRSEPGPNKSHETM